jgi:hypothetical protein
MESGGAFSAEYTVEIKTLGRNVLHRMDRCLLAPRAKTQVAFPHITPYAL